MSQSYNIALLRQSQFQETHESYLREIAQGLQDVLDSKIEAKELEPLVSKAHTLYANLMMVNHQSSLTLALVLKKALSVLAKSEEKELNFVTIQQIAVKALEFTNAFSRHMKDLINGVGDMAVVIWPYWVQLNQSLGEPEPKIEELFDINPNFDDVNFTPKSATYLNDTVARAFDIYQTDVLMKIEERNTVGEMEQILQSALNVFNDLYSLRHRRSFQLYWLIMRARIAAGLMKPQKLVEEKDYWQALFRAAGIQIRKFQGDTKSRTLPFEVLYQALSPLLKPWPEKWKSGNPYLQELDARLGLSSFWKNVEEVKSEQSEGSQFYKRQDEIQNMLLGVQKAWANLAASNDKKRTKLCVLFLRELAPLLVNKGWVPGTLLNPVFDVLKFIAEQLTASIQETKELPPLSDIMIQEVASLLLLTSEIVERKVRWSDELETRVRSQRFRVDVALTGNSEQLSNIPYVHWDTRWREKKIGDATKKAFVLIQKPTEAFENIFHKLSSQNKDEFLFTADYDLDNIRSHSNSLVHDADFMHRVLLVLRQPLAAALIKAVGEQLKTLLDAKAEDEKFAVLSTAMAAFSRFVKGVIDDESEPKLLLKPGLVLLFGEEEYETLISAENNVVVQVPKAKEIELDPRPEPQKQEGVAEESEKSNVKVAVDYKKLLLTDGVVEVVKDEELTGVFLEETKDIFVENEKQRSILLMDGSDQDAWETLRRGYHTLKGSARITGMFGLGEIAWWLEERINEGMSAEEVYSSELDQLSELTDDVLRNYYKELSESQSVRVFGHKVWEKLEETEVSASNSEEVDFDEDDPLAGLDVEEADSTSEEVENQSIEEHSAPTTAEQDFLDDLLPAEENEQVVEVASEEANEEQDETGVVSLDSTDSGEEMDLLSVNNGLIDDLKALLPFGRKSLQQSLDTAEMLGVLDVSQVYNEMLSINDVLNQLGLPAPEILMQRLFDLKDEEEISLDENSGNVLRLALQEFCLMIEGYENNGAWNKFDSIDKLLNNDIQEADKESEIVEDVPSGDSVIADFNEEQQPLEVVEGNSVSEDVDEFSDFIQNLGNEIEGPKDAEQPIEVVEEESNGGENTIDSLLHEEDTVNVEQDAFVVEDHEVQEVSESEHENSGLEQSSGLPLPKEQETPITEEVVQSQPANSIMKGVQPIDGDGHSIEPFEGWHAEQEEEQEDQGPVRDVKQLESLIENLSLNTTVLQQLLKKVELEYPENSKEEKRMRGLLWKLSQESLSMMQLGLFALHQSTSMLNKLDYREEE